MGPEGRIPADRLPGRRAQEPRQDLHTGIFHAVNELFEILIEFPCRENPVEMPDAGQKLEILGPFMKYDAPGIQDTGQAFGA